MNPLYKMKMKVKSGLKKAAGADTTATGNPDYAAMFNRWMTEHVMKAETVKPDTLGATARGKGLLAGGNKK